MSSSFNSMFDGMIAATVQNMTDVNAPIRKSMMDQTLRSMSDQSDLRRMEIIASTTALKEKLDPEDPFDKILLTAMEKIVSRLSS